MFWVINMSIHNKADVIVSPDVIFISIVPVVELK